MYYVCKGLTIVKQTSDLLKELNSTANIDSYLKDNENYIINQTLCSYLSDLIEAKSLSKSDVIHKSDINEIYAYQIFSGKRFPSRNKLIRICIGAEFSLEEINDVMTVGEFSPLYPKIKWDSIIIFGIQNGHSILQINELLYSHQLETI